MLTLFYALNTCALASHIALEESGAAYEAKRLNFAENEQRKPEYLKINPKSRVPALVTDQGILTETPAILVYIAQSFPEGQSGPAKRSVPPWTNPGLQQLSLLDRARGPRPPYARLPLDR